MVNYLQLNKLHEKFAARGLQILAFPCNQFGHQEWPTEEEIPLSLNHVRPGNGYVPRFPLFSKLKVNGKGTHPVFQFMRYRCTNPRTDISDSNADVIWSPVSQSDLSWNFEKWLIDKKGQPVYRYPGRWDPVELESDIERLLKQ